MRESLWEVVGTRKIGKPTKIHVRAPNLSQAHEEAIKRRVLIHTVRLIEGREGGER